MYNHITVRIVVLAGLVAGGLVLLAHSQEPKRNPPMDEVPLDAAVEVQTPKDVPVERPEQTKSAHELSDIFTSSKALPISGALINQADQSQMRSG
jgi:hypothetical protein